MSEASSSLAKLFTGEFCPKMEDMSSGLGFVNSESVLTLVYDSHPSTSILLFHLPVSNGETVLSNCSLSSIQLRQARGVLSNSHLNVLESGHIILRDPSPGA